MEYNNLVIQINLPEKYYQDAIKIYYEAFEKKFSTVMTYQQAIKTLPRLINGEQVVYALEGERLVGFAGIQHANKPLFKTSFSILVRNLGLIRGIYAGLVMLLFRRPYKKHELLLDGICVDKNIRGKGIGSALLNYIIHFASKNQYKTIRLDVVDTNPRALQLYEKIGFQVIKKRNFFFIQRWMGFSASFTMIKTL